ncbi:MAG: polyamine aminopropyltransferase [Fimbriimonas sp.]
MTRTPGRGPTIVLAVSMFLTGGCGLVAQYILSTVSTYILGNSIEQFSVVIALMLLMMGVAGAAQSLISDRHLVEKFVAVEVLLALLSGFAPVALYAAYAHLTDHFAIVQVSAVLVVGFLIGIEIPLAIRINERYAPSLKGNIASIWSLDYVGSFVGALVWAFFLIKVLPIDRIGFAVAIVNLIVAGLTLAYFARVDRLAWRLPLAGLLATILATMFGLRSAPQWTDGIERSLYDDPIVHAETTPYQRIVVTQNRRLGDTRLYLNGNLQFSSLDEPIYHEHLVHPAMHLAARRRHVLILGGGDGLAVREVLKYADVERVTLVDLDGGMIRLAKDHPVFRRLNEDALRNARVSVVAPVGITPMGMKRPVMQPMGEGKAGGRPPLREIARVEILVLDADRFLDRVAQPADVMIVDLPDPNSIELAKLYSREFYRKARRALARDGIMVVQSTSPYHARETFLCIRRTVESAGFGTLPTHDNVPSFGDWGWILATPAHDEAWLRRRLGGMRQLNVPTRYLTVDLLRRAPIFGREGLKSAYEDVSTLMRPIVLDRYLNEGWRVE